MCKQKPEEFCLTTCPSYPRGRHPAQSPSTAILSDPCDVKMLLWPLIPPTGRLVMTCFVMGFETFSGGLHFKPLAPLMYQLGGDFGAGTVCSL